MKRIHNLRAERVGLMQSRYLPARVIAGPFVIEFVEVSDGSAIKHVCARKQKRPVGHRIKSIHETDDGRVGRDLPSREIASASCSGGNGRDLGNALRLP